MSFLDQLKALGFSGVQNFPTVGLIDGVFRANLEETGMSYALEVEMIAKAHAQGHADHALCVQRGRGRGDGRGRRRHHRLPSWASPPAARSARETALKLRGLPGAGRRLGGGGARGQSAMSLVLAHGGPVAEPADAEFIMKNTPQCHGFYGASSMERLPVERALTEQVRQFKAIGGR